MSFKLSNIDDLLFDFQIKPDEKSCCITKSNLIQEKDNVYICKVCNKIVSYTDETDTGIHEDNLFNSIYITGKNAYKYRKLIHNNTNYSTIRDKNTTRDFLKFDNDNNDKKIPKEVLKYAIDIFKQLQNANVVLRANIRKGTMAQCLLYGYNHFNIPKTEKEISLLTKVSEKYMNKGKETLIRKANEKVIDINIESKINDNFITEYFDTLYINKYYTDFLLNIVKINNLDNKTKILTKSFGIIYYMNSAIRNFRSKYPNVAIEPLFNKEIQITKKNETIKMTEYDDKTFVNVLKKNYNVSKSSYIKFYNTMIFYRSFIKKFCIDYKVPYPVKRKDKGIMFMLVNNNNRVDHD